MLAQNQFKSSDNSNLVSWVPIISNQVPVFGSIVNWDVNINGKILDLQLILNCGSLTNAGIASVATSTPIMNNAFHWPILQQYNFGNNVIELANNHQNFILQMLYNHDQDLKFLQSSSGGSTAQRWAMSNTTSNWNIPLRSFINTLQIENLGVNSHNFRLSITLDQLTNLCTTVLGTLTIPSMTINSAVLMARVVRYDAQVINFKQLQLQKNVNYRDIFYNHLTQSSVISTGSTTSTILLSNFSASNIQFIYFTIRPTANLNRETVATYVNNITQFNLLSATNESLCGGPISSLMSLFVLNKSMTQSSFTADVGASVFGYWHCISPIQGMKFGGSPSGYRSYSGTESLQITWNGALTQPHQVDVYASTLSVFTQSMSSVTKT